MDYNLAQGVCTLTNIGDDFTGTLPINVSSYVNNGLYVVRVSATNTTITPTLNLNGLGLKTITAKDGSAIAIGQISINSWHLMMFVSNVFVLLTTEVIVNNSGISGSGTINYVSKFISSNSIGNSLIIDNGTNIGINNAPQASHKLYINSDKLVGLGVVNNAVSGSNNYGISGSATNANTDSNIGVFGNALLSSGGTNLGVRGMAASETVTTSPNIVAAGSNVGGFFQGNASSGISYGLVASADAITDQASATFIGAYIRADNAGTKYSLRLEDGSEGTGKFLKSVTPTGLANWASLAITDIKASLGTSLQYVRVNAAATALEYATLPSSVIKIGTAVYTPNTTVNSTRITVNFTVSGALVTDFVVANINNSMRLDLDSYLPASHFFLDLQAYVSATNTVTLTYMLSQPTLFTVNSSINLMVQR